ncbi:AAA family ATPase [Desulfohalobiaceae bacterium Ax17]|uniref:Lon protease family protein n=1 Tax=Desulfovulcanus ferrireducens TaxID=2831190 RepID=UPI00207BB283|nr:ATP-binding protein [Desulfovulcanus ferrireducens]MBT8763105.1 AAA family ATPase [Desulfovulcanus ferrireducens]
MVNKNALGPTSLRVKLNPKKISFAESTKPSYASSVVYQQRALEALELALYIQKKGYNVYLSGEPGLGRTYFVSSFLKPRALQGETPVDWIYVYNFDDPDRPLAISLPPGQGKELKRDLAKAIKKIRQAIPVAFEQDNYVQRHDRLIKEFNAARDNLLDRMEEHANLSGFSLNMEDGALTLYPLMEGKVLTPDEFERLDPDVKKKLKTQSNKIMEALLALSRQITKEEQDLRESEKKLDQEIAGEKIDLVLKKIKKKYAGIPRLKKYFDSLKKDILDNLDQFRPKTQSQEHAQEILGGGEDFFHRYEVNLFVDNSSQKGAPIIIEDNPSYFNLLGCIERETELGTYYTDFTLLKAGSIHRANGGYLIVRAEDILSHPSTWEGLLRCLRAGKSSVDEPAEHYDLIRTKTIEPEAIPLKVKVIIIGSDELYDLLLENDERFRKLFKIKAHLQDNVVRNDENIQKYVQILTRMARENQLKPFTRDGLAVLVDYSSRLAQDQQRLSLHFSEMREVMIEADAYAALKNKKKVNAKMVRKALKAREHRLNLYEEEFLSDYDRELIKVQTKGSAVGRANGLSVTSIGDFVLALPHQISCTVGVGHGGIIDLEREAELGGPIHTKGMMILKSYLQNLFAQDKPLVLAGSLCIEQSYAQIDGDSASGAELAALLSALADIPINLSLAFTGAMSQSGAIMAVGEVTRKVEGFFEVCKRRGLTGEQGVIIPKDNITHLMLKEEVILAVKEKKFHIYAVENIEQAMEILTGVKAGRRLKKGGFTKGSIYWAVDKRLRELAYLAEKKVRRRAG